MIQNTQRTAAIGFGCSSLSHHITRKEAIKNLETAYEAGVRHFDVARLYGFGIAEGIVGEFAKNKRGTITITTKTGLSSDNPFLKSLVLQNLARKAYRVIKGNAGKKGGDPITVQKPLTNFTKIFTEESLSTSLKELKTDYIDYLLLHEPVVGEANQEEILNFLEEKKSKGIIRAYGIASFSHFIEKDFAELDSSYSVLQTNNSFPYTIPMALQESTAIQKRFYFSPFWNIAQVKQLFKSDKIFADQISDIAGFDVAKSTLDLFLIHQFLTQPSGTMLFTSSDNMRIQQTVEGWERIKNSALPGQLQFENIRNLIKARLL